jgi:hypothetical protein
VKQPRVCIGPVERKLNFPNLIRISATVVEMKYLGNDLPARIYVFKNFGGKFAHTEAHAEYFVPETANFGVHEPIIANF